MHVAPAADLDVGVDAVAAASTSPASPRATAMGPSSAGGASAALAHPHSQQQRHQSPSTTQHPTAAEAAAAVSAHHHSAGTTMALDLLAGTAAGTAQLLVGHPFDTIKVKMQSQSGAAGSAQFRGPLDAAKQTLAKEGLRGFYRGACPLCMLCCCAVPSLIRVSAADQSTLHLFEPPPPTYSHLVTYTLKSLTPTNP